MKKFVKMTIASMLLITSTTYASEKFDTLNKVDTKVLFGQHNISTIELNQNEMIETEGKFIWAIIAGVALWNIGFANAPSLWDTTYNGTLIDRPKRGSRWGGRSW